MNTSFNDTPREQCPGQPYRIDVGDYIEFDFTRISVRDTPEGYRWPTPVARAELLALKDQEPQEFDSGAFLRGDKELSYDLLPSHWPIVIDGLERHRHHPVSEEELLQKVMAHYPERDTKNNVLVPFGETSQLHIEHFNMYLGQLALDTGGTIEHAVAFPAGWRAVSPLLPVTWFWSTLEVASRRNEDGQLSMQWKADSSGTSYKRAPSRHPTIPHKPPNFMYTHLIAVDEVRGEFLRTVPLASLRKSLFTFKDRLLQP